jgi:replicative DNA helicase
MTDAIVLSTQAPHSHESEQAVISSVLSNNNWYPVVASFLKPSHFYILRHEYIWQAFERLYARSMAIDYLTVTEELKAMGHLDDCGGTYYLIQLNAPSSANAETYARLVLSAFVRRQMLVAADVIRNVAIAETEFDVEQARAEMQRQAAIVMEVELDRRERSLTDIALERQSFIEERMQNPNLLLGIPTGLTALDEILAGLQRSDLIVLAGVPGMGKTSLMLCILLFAAKVGKRVGFVSQEMGSGQIWDRLTALETGLNLQKIRTGNLSKAEYDLYFEASLRLKSLPFYIHDGTVTPLQLRVKGLKWAAQRGIDMLMLDYLQIMSSGGAFKPAQRAQEVGYFARSSKALAKELNIPMVCAAQLNREVQGVPELRHLRDSGEIEQEADVVTFIHRPDYYTPTERPGEADLVVAKQRNGPIGTVTVIFDKPTTKFKNATRYKVDFKTGEIS